MMRPDRRSRTPVAWQVILADLSLILFITVLAGLVATHADASSPDEDFAVETGQAVYRQIEGGPTLEEWLANEALDPRARLTIIGRYSREDEAEVAAEAIELWSEALRSGHDARLVIERGEQSKVLAQLAFDRALENTAE